MGALAATSAIPAREDRGRSLALWVGHSSVPPWKVWFPSFIEARRSANNEPAGWVIDPKRGRDVLPAFFGYIGCGRARNCVKNCSSSIRRLSDRRD